MMRHITELFGATQIGSDDDRKVHLECQHFDADSRAALRGQLQSLHALARAQVKRSGETAALATSILADDVRHEDDIRFTKALAVLLTGEP